MAKVHDILELWQGSLHLRATQKESRAHNKQMTAVGYISDTEEIIKAYWSLFHHHGAAAFKLSERSPLPPALSAKTSLQDELKYYTSAKSAESTVMQSKVMRIAHLEAFRTRKVG